MQIVFEESTTTIWMFASSKELLELAKLANNKTVKTKLGDSLTILESNISNSDITFKISVSNL